MPLKCMVQGLAVARPVRSAPCLILQTYTTFCSSEKNFTATRPLIMLVFDTMNKQNGVVLRRVFRDACAAASRDSARSRLTKTGRAES